ncbi:PREDICTED: uncharacterized protein LOC104719194 [Camelina sativa]|uniref:Uncharacterized protein LOC104719194 n=1 Tax=Camelina sativa TaxID=90675 RepID=A0ABM1QI46_CAMSA|nr:PREDICTED: uncharacterized protein LOC104719194 [Camelina sativa]
MSLFTLFFACFVPNSSSRVYTTDNTNLEVLSTLKRRKSKSESLRTPSPIIIVSYFPASSTLSRL